MPGYVLNADTVATCPHGGQVSFQASQGSVNVDSSPALLISDQATISGCAFMIGPNPSPCLTVSWISPTASQKLKVTGSAVLLSTTVGLCTSGANVPQGPVVLSTYQQRVKVT